MRRTGGQVNMTLMTAVSGNTFYYDWEVSLMEWIQAHLGTFGTYAASFFSLFGEELVCVGILGLLYWCLDKEFGKKVGLTLLFAGTANTILLMVMSRISIAMFLNLRMFNLLYTTTIPRARVLPVVL